MSLRADVGLNRGDLHIEVWLEARAGQVLALLGPNGAGKTSVLRAIAGLAPIDRGAIELDGVVFDNPAAGAFLEPADRGCGVVFQDYRLFPNLSVAENVGFGLRAAGVERRRVHSETRQWLERLGIADLAAASPRHLSGGQQQRVALARALATRPKVLLLDEPTSALDARTRVDVRRQLRAHLDAFDGPVIVVTHDPVDAHGLADTVVVIEHGRVVQSGALGELAAHPRSAYVAELVGVNLLSGTLLGGVFVTDDGATMAVADHHPDGAAIATVHPTAVSLHHTRPEGSMRNVWAGTVSEIDHRGDRVRVGVAGPVYLTAEITAGAAEQLQVRRGIEMWVAVKATEISVSPA